jgi:hypothetical protein
VKTKRVAALTALLFTIAMTCTVYAAAPPEMHVKHCRMQMMHPMSHQVPQAPHECKHQKPVMPCCPLPTNPSQGSSPMECMTGGGCCQISEERTRPTRRDAQVQQSSSADEKPAVQGAAQIQDSRRASFPRWVEVELRHAKRVCDLKTDLRI